MGEFILFESRRRLPLSALRSFEVAARRLSFLNAAHELAVTPAAVSHAIRQLEQELGCTLFIRHIRKVSLTPAGERLMADAGQAFDLLAASLTRLKQGHAEVTITATMAFSSRWLVPRLRRLREEHSDLTIKILATDAVVNLDAGGADLAIRYGSQGTGTGRDRFLFQDRFAPVCAPRLKIESLEDLQSIPLIETLWSNESPLAPTWARWAQAAGLATPLPPSVIKVNDEGHAIQAALVGQGIVLASLPLVKDELERGLLLQPFPATLTGPSCRLVESDTLTAPAAVVRDWIAREFDPAQTSSDT
jgi:LysR family transcriptional regulator, glycine cleavage system transcriptional activator